MLVLFLIQHSGQPRRQEFKHFKNPTFGYRLHWHGQFALSAKNDTVENQAGDQPGKCPDTSSQDQGMQR
jgi:hypothetical protein